MAKKIPGKEEFYETIRYFKKRIEVTGVNLELNSRQSAQSLMDQNFDEIILATGVSPRITSIPGEGHPKVLNYMRNV